MDLRAMLRAAGLAGREAPGDGPAERASAYFQVAGVMLVVVGSDHRLREINRRGLDILGYDRPEEIVGRNWLEVCLPPDARAAAAAWLDRFLAGDPDAPAEGMFEVRRRDGAMRLISWRHAVLRDATGRAIAKVSSGEDITERRDSEARFRVLADTVPGLLFASDPCGGNTFVNRGFATFAGLPAEALLGDGWKALVHPEDLPLTRAAWQEALATGGPYSVEYRVRRHDGAWRWHLCRGLPLRDAAGGVVQWFGVAVDIDDRKRAEAAAQAARETLAAADRRQRFLLELSERQRAQGDPEEAVRIAVASLGAALDVDRAIYADFTADHRHLIVAADWPRPGSGLAPIDRFHRLSPHWELLLPDLEDGKVVRIADIETDPRTAALVGTANRPKYSACIVVPLVKAGSPLGGLIVYTLVPRAWTDEEASLAAAVAERTFAAVEHGRADLALRASEERMSLAIEAAGIATWDIDFASGKRVWSRTHFLMLGLDPDRDVAGAEAWRTQVHPDDRPFVEAAVQRSRTGDVPYEAEYRFRRADTGAERWMSSRGRFLRDGSGKFRRMVGISVDVTDRRSAEDALRDAAHALEVRVAARTAELAAAHDRLIAEAAERERLEEQLRQTQKLQAVGQLAGGIAHDFNNLLTAVLGSLELLERHVATDPARRLLTAARAAADRGSTLTNQLLAFARRQKLAVRPVDVVALVRQMDEMLRRTLGGLITLRLDLSGDACPVETDPVQLELSVLNLAINARDAMPQGGTLTVAVRREVPAQFTPDLAQGPHIVIAVSDTGPGMLPEVRARAFEPFFTTKEIGRGTGLGLAQVYGVARQSGGTARIAAAPGEGTQVEIWLPCGGSAEEELAQIVPLPAEPAEAVASLLLVDDEEQVRAFAAEVLREAGYDVIEAPDGAAALAVLAGGAHIDLLVTDFAMPGMTGLALIETARLRHPRLPALLVSGYAEIGGASASADAQLRKPFRGADLRAAVAELLAASRAAAAQPLVAPAVSPAM